MCVHTMYGISNIDVEYSLSSTHNKRAELWPHEVYSLQITASQTFVNGKCHDTSKFNIR